MPSGKQKKILLFISEIFNDSTVVVSGVAAAAIAMRLVNCFDDRWIILIVIVMAY